MSVCGCASSPRSGLVTPGADHELIDAEQALFTAMTHADVRALELLVADDCVFRIAQGNGSVGRREFLASAVALQGSVLELRGEKLQARAFAQAGVVSGLQHSRRKASGGAEIAEDTPFIDVFERRGGRWMLVMALSAPH